MKQVQLIKIYCSNKDRAIGDRYFSENSYIANSQLIILIFMVSDDEEEDVCGLKNIWEKIKNGSNWGTT